MFKYKTTTLNANDDHRLESLLNQEAKDGWALHSVIPIAGSYGATVRLKILFQLEIHEHVDGGPR